MKLKIEINLGNAAFADDGSFEVSRILRQYADYVDGMDFPRFGKRLYDVNGNLVGQAEIVEVRP